MKAYEVIMAGGGGTRFWPLSRQAAPKQILNLTGNDVMLNETIERMIGIVDYEHVVIITNEVQGNIVKDVIKQEVPKANILLEPEGRNTAPCIAYAALVIQKREGDALMCVKPSDHYIKDEKEFRRVVRYACDTAEKSGSLVTIGINPTFPCTGYGYIYIGEQQEEELYKVNEFVEKPNYATAQSYMESGKYLWNSGMFVWKASAILDNIKRFLPKLYNRLMELEPYIDTPKEKEMLQKIYPLLPKISIDYGIMERSDDVLVIPGDFGWSDVGSWDSLGSVHAPDEKGNISVGEHILQDTASCIVYGEKHLIATLGTVDLIIVHTDDATLVADKARAQDVKDIVDTLKEQGRSELL